MGVNLERDEETSLPEMKKTGLIDCVISAVWLDGGMAKGKYTPTGSVTLVNNEDCVPVSGSFNCRRFGGMLIYLSEHTCSDIAFSVNCCTRYMFVPNIHTKRIWSELVGIWNWPGIMDWSWIPIGSYSIPIVILMQISLECMDTKIWPIPLILIVSTVT